MCIRDSHALRGYYWKCVEAAQVRFQQGCIGAVPGACSFSKLEHYCHRTGPCTCLKDEAISCIDRQRDLGDQIDA
eukprot:10826379-Prorocentrum_lima.AAC.1